MNEKLSLQNIADALAQKAGVSKKVGETFAKAFFETVADALSRGQESIKVKGLGTFKLVQVDSRESVNVSNGERIVIAGYKKVAFTPEDSVLEVLNGLTEMESSDSLAASVENSSTSEKSLESEQKEEELPVSDNEIDTLIEMPAPAHVEQPQDAFAGIDMLISTPESVEEVRRQYEEAQAKLETAIAEARKANVEKLRLEKLLERLEKNVEPEAVHAEEPADSHTETTDNPSASEASVDEDEASKRQEAFNRVMAEQPTEETHTEKKSHKKGWLVAAIVLLLAVLGTLVYMIHLNIERVEQVPTVAQTTKPAKPVVPKPTPPPPAPKADKDSLAKAVQVDSVKVDKVVKVDTAKDTQTKPERPKTHRMQRGESLTKISQKYYGTKDSVRAILRVNAFNDPNNLPVGTMVNLP